VNGGHVLRFAAAALPPPPPARWCCPPTACLPAAAAACDACLLLPARHWLAYCGWLLLLLLSLHRCCAGKDHLEAAPFSDTEDEDDEGTGGGGTDDELPLALSQPPCKRHNEPPRQIDEATRRERHEAKQLETQDVSKYLGDIEGITNMRMGCSDKWTGRSGRPLHLCIALHPVPLTCAVACLLLQTSTGWRLRRPACRSRRSWQRLKMEKTTALPS
jgi:hypothetical protein